MTHEADHNLAPDDTPDLSQQQAERLGEALRIYRRDHKPDVPSSIDDRLMREAKRALGGATPRRTIHRGRVWGLTTAGVAAGLALITWMSDFWRPLEPTPVRPNLAARQTGDVNADGAVNILDAMTLDAALRLAAADQTAPAPTLVADMNQDGAVDERDVQMIAELAVRLPEGRG